MNLTKFWLYWTIKKKTKINECKKIEGNNIICFLTEGKTWKNPCNYTTKKSFKIPSKTPIFIHSWKNLKNMISKESSIWRNFSKLSIQLLYFLYNKANIRIEQDEMKKLRYIEGNGFFKEKICTGVHLKKERNLSRGDEFFQLKRMLFFYV